ncbi:glycosyltransferase family 4 protein [Virgibacillus sp. W0181]|uniref:glycosyltransferase family 4 protein n=1 Tax=Virgibacillus sp. W0181 TaxID=3391581 RepID=UPI003F466679
MKNRNIVFVLNEYNDYGGAQRVTATLANEFIRDNHNVFILSINENKQKGSYFSENVKVHVLHSDGYRAPGETAIMPNFKKGKMKKVFVEWKRRSQLKKKRQEVINLFKKKLGNEEVFVIVIQVWGMQWIEPLLYKQNIKIIGQSHESVSASKGTHRYKRILKYYRQVTKFLLLTKNDAEYFKELGFTNTGVVHNPSSFRIHTDALSLYSNKKIVSTGRLIEDKGFDVLIESFARIASNIPGWELYIYGEGPEKKTLQTLINALGMQDRIQLKGQSNNIENVLRSASFFVLSSRAEGLPMSLIEAKSCGLPCISTDCAPGIREIIEEYKDGLIAPVDDIPVLSRHMRRLAQNQNLFTSFSQNAYENSVKFDKGTIKQQWYDLFNVLGEN